MMLSNQNLTPKNYTLEVVRAFHAHGKVYEPGDQVVVPRQLAQELLTANKARLLQEDPYKQDD